MKTISSEEFDQKFDDGEDVNDYVDWSKSTRPGQELSHADVDLPTSILLKVDAEAMRLGVTRQALLAEWISEKLAHVPSSK
jgi:hypothetical protein